MSEYLEIFLCIFLILNPVCTFVFCFKCGASIWLFITYFLEGSFDGSDVLTARVNSSCLGFCGRSENVLERIANYVDRSVDAVRFINPSEVVMDGDAAAGFG